MTVTEKVAFCFLLRGHPPSCLHWQKWAAQSAGAPWCKVVVHCDKCEELPVCSASCILQGAERVESVATTWGGPGVVCAESRLYRRAFLDASVRCAVLLTDWCAPVYDAETLRRRLLSSTPLSRVNWHTAAKSLNRFTVKAELQKVVDRVFAQEWCRAADLGPTAGEMASHLEVVRQERLGLAPTNEQNVDEVTCIRRLVRRKGKEWLQSAVIPEQVTLSVFDDKHGDNHRSEVVDLTTLRPRFFRDHGFLFVRKVHGKPPTWYPLHE